jgi:hypothetical protein
MCSARRDAKMRFGRFDWTADSSADKIQYYLESSYYGKSAVLVRAPTDLWAAGVTTSVSGASPEWMFTLFKINEADASVS